MLRMNFPQRKKIRLAEAIIRQESASKRSTLDQKALLSNRPGESLKEWKKLEQLAAIAVKTTPAPKKSAQKKPKSKKVVRKAFKTDQTAEAVLNGII